MICLRIPRGLTNAGGFRGAERRCTRCKGVVEASPHFLQDARWRQGDSCLFCSLTKKPIFATIFRCKSCYPRLPSSFQVFSMSETSAFNADIQQLMRLMINKHLLLQPGYPSSRADFKFFRCPRHCQVRVYHLSRKDRGPTKFLHREHRRIRPSRPSRLRTLALV